MTRAVCPKEEDTLRRHQGPDLYATVKAAFGANNRKRLIDAYFAGQAPLTRETAWAHVYRLLLWIDQATGRAYSYESDTCQPTENWYGPSLAFHDWVASSLSVPPSKLAEGVDWLFRKATSDLAAAVEGFPEPGEDPELVSIITGVLEGRLSSQPTTEEWQILVRRIKLHLMLENKRRSRVGEGFEDVLAAVIKRSPDSSMLDVRTRHFLHDLPGFNRAKQGEKPNKVDLAILRPQLNQRILVTAKWSLRADREKQFTSEFGEYAAAESSRQPFEYVFVTNEFDPARLMRACEALLGHNHLFSKVVHISTDALKATYGAAARKDTAENGAEESMKKVVRYIDEDKRLIDLKTWLGSLVVQGPEKTKNL